MNNWTIIRRYKIKSRIKVFFRCKSTTFFWNLQGRNIFCIRRSPKLGIVCEDKR